MPIILSPLPVVDARFLQVDVVLNKVRIILQDLDPDAYRSDNAELLGWLDDAVNAVLSLVPTLFAKSGTHVCTSGVQQRLVLERAASLIDVVGVAECDPGTLTLYAPGWQSAAPGAIQNWMRIASNPLGFRTFPPSSAGQVLEVEYVEAPEKLAIGGLVPLPEVYEAALVDYVAGMTQMKEDESINFERQAALMTSFAARIKG